MATNWWMYHGDPAHSGFVQGGNITSKTASSLKVLHELHLGGPILSVPAVVDGFIYVGLANSHASPGSNGGLMLKINVATGQTVASFRWDILPGDRDSHGFTGMGCTPAVTGGKVIFCAFDGKIYCLDQGTMSLLWVTDLRNVDLAHRQPISNNNGDGVPAEGWSSPLIVQKTGRVYMGFGEGENPLLFGWVYCLDMYTGNVIWAYCTCPVVPGQPNKPNVLPPDVVTGPLSPPFQKASQNPPTRGCSVWAAVAYDETLNRIYCCTGNPQPDGVLPTAGLSNGLLSLDAATGEFRGFFQTLPQSSYRVSDLDVDVGGAPTLFTINGRRAVAFGCKNGGFFVLDAITLQVIQWRTLLPYVVARDSRVPTLVQIPAIDPHSNDPSIMPHVSNQESNNTPGENYMGTYSTAAVDPIGGRLFIGVGGKSYNTVSPGIDSTTTPFMRAMRWDTLEDAWPTEAQPISGDLLAELSGEIQNPSQAMLTKYTKCAPPMYANAGESALSSPAVVNDVVFCSTSNVTLYAFATADGTPLWQDNLGMQTGGFTGGYGYCLGPAIWGDYVVAGALVFGQDGGVLKIYKLGA